MSSCCSCIKLELFRKKNFRKILKRFFQIFSYANKLYQVNRQVLKDIYNSLNVEFKENGTP